MGIVEGAWIGALRGGMGTEAMQWGAVCVCEM